MFWIVFSGLNYTSFFAKYQLRDWLIFGLTNFVRFEIELHSSLLVWREDR